MQYGVQHSCTLHTEQREVLALTSADVTTSMLIAADVTDAQLHRCYKTHQAQCDSIKASAHAW
jgi:hypothetical protein